MARSRGQRLLTGAVLLGVVAVAAAGWATFRDAQAAGIVVYRSPACGCCGKWIEHLRESGFSVEAVSVSDLAPVKAEHGITAELASCHTAVIDGYVIEGHVPADVIRKMLAERPAIAGLAVPGMPMGSPGMEGPYTQQYNVLAFDEAGETTVYARR